MRNGPGESYKWGKGLSRSEMSELAHVGVGGKLAPPDVTMMP
jgi:hypothetical protein